MDDIPVPMAADSKNFLDRLRLFIRSQNKAYKPEQTYVGWTWRFILFHDRRNPREMGAREVEQFLSHLAVNRNASINTQKTALNALMFVYRQFLSVDMQNLSFNYAKVPRNIPVVFTHKEAKAVLEQLSGRYQLMGNL